MSLVARHLESVDIPTVVVGSARDIVEYCAVPRFLFVDFPLGNPCGKPNDEVSQRAILGQALDLLRDATVAQTTVKATQSWGDDQWRATYMRLDETESG